MPPPSPTTIAKTATPSRSKSLRASRAVVGNAPPCMPPTATAARSIQRGTWAAEAGTARQHAARGGGPVILVDMSNLSRRPGSGLSRSARERRAYQLAVTGGGAAVVAVVALVLAIAGGIGSGVVLVPAGRGGGLGPAVPP